MTTTIIHDEAAKVSTKLDLTLTTASKFCDECEAFGLDIEVAVAFWDHTGLYGVDLADVEDMIQTAQDAYCGTFESVEDYATDYIESTGMLKDVAELIARYFDYEAFARDLVLGGDIFAVETGYRVVHIFNNHA